MTIFIILLVGIIAYIYYQLKSPMITLSRNGQVIPKASISRITDNNLTIKPRHSKPTNKSMNRPTNNRPTNHNFNKNKKVKFDDNVKYYFYEKDPKEMLSESPATRAYLGTPMRGREKINVDDIFSTETNYSPVSSKSSSSYMSDEPSEISIRDYLSDRMDYLSDKILPGNFEEDNPNDSWDSSFGMPLMTDAAKQKFASKMHQNHKLYQKSLGQFNKYQLDNSTLIKTDVTIDPFKPEKNSKNLKGKTIGQIYDEQVAGPKAIPKKIKTRTPTSIIYENESEMNGGLLKGTNLCGFDGISGSYKTAAFGNEF